MLKTRVAKVSCMTRPCGKLQKEKAVTHVSTDCEPHTMSPTQSDFSNRSDFKSSGDAGGQNNKPPKYKNRTVGVLVREKVTTRKYYVSSFKTDELRMHWPGKWMMAWDCLDFCIRKVCIDQFDTVVLCCPFSHRLMYQKDFFWYAGGSLSHIFPLKHKTIKMFMVTDSTL